MAKCGSPAHYQAAMRRLLHKHNAKWARAWDRRSSECQYASRIVSSPEVRDAMSFYLFAHEIAHLALDHQAFDWGWREIEADIWALRQLKRVRGYVPATVERTVRSRCGYILRDAVIGRRHGLPLDLGIIVRQLKNV